MIFVPSIQKQIDFKPLTIKQYKDILKSNRLNQFKGTGFNLGIINVIEEGLNSIELITDFDKHIIALQLRYRDILLKEIIQKVKHPKEKKIKEDIYCVTLKVPFLNLEKQYTEYILQNKNSSADMLILAEIVKYISYLSINSTDINFNINYKDKIDIVKDIPVPILAKCINYIDTVKEDINKYYDTIGYTHSKYSVSLLIL